MKKIRIIKHRVAALFTTLILMSGLITPAFSINVHAEAVEVLNATSSVADLVMSYMASGGVVMTNTQAINELYQYVGSEFGTLQSFVNDGLLTYSNGQYVDTGLSQSISGVISSIESFDLNSLFSQTATQNPAGVALTGSASLAGIAGSVATTGFLPVTAGVAVAGYCGFQIGTIISNMLQEFAPYIYNGVAIDTADYDVLSKVPIGSRTAIFKSSSGSKTFYSGVNCIGCTYPGSNGSVYTLYCYSGTNNKCARIVCDSDGVLTSNTQDTASAGSSKFSLTSSTRTNISFYAFNSQSAYENFKTQLRNGDITLPNVYSPDLIGPDGNLVGSVEDGNYTVPDMLPQADPSYQRLNPGGITQEDWLRYANQAKGNTGNGQPELNADILSSIINAIRSNIPGVVPPPGTGDDPGTVPGTNPQPTPTPNPDPDYDVDQPETSPQESETVETDPNLDPPNFLAKGFMDKFPFCIPRDISLIFGKFRNSTRQAPYISWRFNPPGTPIDYTFNLNLSDFEEVATLLRTLELIAFVVGLAYATRYLIGSS